MPNLGRLRNHRGIAVPEAKSGFVSDSPVVDITSGLGGFVTSGALFCSGAEEDVMPGMIPMAFSVPEENSLYIASGRVTLRTMRGVISKTSSVLDLSRLSLENRRPNKGKSPKPGTLFTAEVWLFWIKPARICVSPSLSLNAVDVFRVPNW